MVTYSALKTDNTPPYNPFWCRCWNSMNRDIEFTNGDWENVTTTLYFEWGDAVDWDSGVSGYSIYWGTNSYGEPGYIQTIEHNNINSYEISEDMGVNILYYLRIRTRDNSNNWTDSKTLFELKFDNIVPTISNITLNSTIFSPDGDGQQDNFVMYYNLGEECYVTIKILSINQTVVRIIEDNNLKSAGVNSFEWDGKDNTGNLADDDNFLYSIELIDRANNKGIIYTGNLGKQALSGDEMRPKEKVLFLNNSDNINKILFKGIQNSNVNVNIYNLSGIKVRELTNVDGWDGKDNNGIFVPSGIYLYQYEYKDKKFQGTIVVAR